MNTKQLTVAATVFIVTAGGIAIAQQADTPVTGTDTVTEMAEGSGDAVKDRRARRGDKDCDRRGKKHRRGDRRDRGDDRDDDQAMIDGSSNVVPFAPVSTPAVDA